MEAKVIDGDSPYDQLSKKLLKDGYYLTALELFAELTETGKELPGALKEFISSKASSTAEQDSLSSRLERSSSMQTFDSLDLTRCSEDGERQWERIAVLEFELRRAKETINSLRENLTTNYTNAVQESDASISGWGTTPAGNGDDIKSLKSFLPLINEPIKPQEKRAINFLIHEYLVKHNYKVTSVTFSDENDDQDFDEWADVGLNIDKPPDLAHFYRTYWIHCNHCKADNTAEVKKEDEKVNCEINKEDHFEKDFDQDKEVIDLASTPKVLECDSIVLKGDSNIEKVDIEIQTDPIPEISPSSSHQLLSSSSSAKALPTELEKASQSIFTEDKDQEKDVEELDTNRKLSVPSNLKILAFKFNTDSLASLDEMSNTGGNQILAEYDGSIKECLTFNEFQDIVFTLSHQPDPRQLLNCFIPPEKIAGKDSQAIIALLTEYLPQIISNQPTNKRCNLIPLLMVTILLNPNPRDRDVLLKTLFNIIKKPNEEQRRAILASLVYLGNCLTSDTVANELLPILWEDINSRIAEKRLLIAESIGSLTPFLPSNIRSSLFLSILGPIVQDIDLSVKLAGVKSLTILISFLADDPECDKMSGIISMVFGAMESSLVEDDQIPFPAVNVEDCLLNTLLPVCALAAFKANCFRECFVERFMANLVKFASEEEKKDVFLRYWIGFNNLLSFIFIDVIKNQPNNPPKEEDNASQGIDLSSIKSNIYQCPLLNQMHLLTDNQFISYINQVTSDPFEGWPEFDWILSLYTKKLIPLIRHLKMDNDIISCATQIFARINYFFGPIISKRLLKPCFLEKLRISSEQNDEISDNFTNAMLPIYFNGLFMLHPSIYEDPSEIKDMNNCLLEGLMSLSLYNYSLASFEMTISIAFEARMEKSVKFILNFFREALTHSNPFVRRNIAHLYKVLCEKGLNDSLLPDSAIKESILPSLITLSSDVDIQVRGSSIGGFAALLLTLRSRLENDDPGIIECWNKAQLQLQSYFEDQLNREQHLIQLELIKMFTQVASCIDSSQNEFDTFFIRFAIPRLSALAAQCGNHSNPKTKRQDIFISLLDAYGSFSKVSHEVIADQSIKEAILPALRCIKEQIIQVAPDYKDAANFLINEFERRVSVVNSSMSGNLSPAAVNNNKPNPSSPPMPLPTLGSVSPSTSLSSIANNQMVDEVKNKVRGILNKSSSVGTAARTNLTNMFKRR